MMDGLVNVLLFDIVHLYISLGKLKDCCRDDCCNFWVREGRQCLGHDGWLATIAVGCSMVMLQLLCHPGKLVRCSLSKIEDVAL